MQSDNFIKNNFVSSSALPTENSTDSMKKSDLPMPSNSGNFPDSSKNNPVPSTPAIVKARRVYEQFNIHSPSDNMLSPCTKKLFSNKPRSKKISASHPMNILRIKQQEALYNQKNE
ncbi:Spo12 family-containing protein [Strongyloides ratti]|uniref:Spo12 family-containing protein n=1 Tax=Strongyloides ratti TaxID=34506 RepID=A0A090LDS4_STRRB|nr:Spo12 family-containing protein [Strongyloides ratti]CEF67951.1 Spo12 family-containing protein [Strongyloides ratti]